jgi:hypothetical protein
VSSCIDFLQLPLAANNGRSPAANVCREAATPVRVRLVARPWFEARAVLNIPFSQRHFHGRPLERVSMFKSALSIEQHLKSWIRATVLKVPIGEFVGLRQILPVIRLT